MKPSDIAKLTSVGDPQLSPDGRNVAYVVVRIDEPKNAYSSQIWVVGTEPGSRPRALTSGEFRDANPRWSPDGSQLAFTSSRAKNAAGKTKSTLHLLPFESPGETVLLAEGDEGFSQPSFSPDGSRLAVVHRVRGEHYESDEISRRPARKITRTMSQLNGEGFTFDRPTHIHVVATDGSGPLRAITAGSTPFDDVAWFPDGDRLAASVRDQTGDMVFDIVSVPADPAEPTDPSSDDPDIAGACRFLTSGSGVYQRCVVTPTSDHVLVRGSHDMVNVYPQNLHYGLVSTSAGSDPVPPAWVTDSVDRNWAPGVGDSPPAFIDNRSFLATYEDRGNTILAQVDTETGQVKPVIEPTGAVTAWSTGTIDGASAVAYCQATSTRPSELFLTVDGETRQLTDHCSGWLDSVGSHEPEHFLAPSGSLEVDAWIIRPADFDPAKKYPALLNINGGPFSQYGNVFHDEFQMQARAGFVVIYSNPRGGSGRDQAWGQAILGPKHRVPGTGWGGADYDDVMAVTDAALEKYDFIDPDRLGVLGGSYGGYLTSWIVTHTNRFAAACSERAANNLLSLEFMSDMATFFKSEVGPTFVDDPDEYTRMSPTSYVTDLNTPLLIIHSEDDLRCPVNQAWQMFNACQTLGKPDVEFWLFPGETHELSRSGSPSHRKQRAEIIHEFFERFLSA